MGHVLKFRGESVSDQHSHSFKALRIDSTKRQPSSTALVQDWLSLAGKLQRLALLAPATAKSLELVVDEMLRQLPP